MNRKKALQSAAKREEKISAQSENKSGKILCEKQQNSLRKRVLLDNRPKVAYGRKRPFEKGENPFMSAILTSFGTVSLRVVELFLLMGVGLLCHKTGWVKDDGIAQMTNVLVKPVTVCVIVESFLTVPFDQTRLTQLLTAAAACVAATAVGGCFALLFRRQPPARRAVLRFGTVFSNSGFMSLPLASALLGEEGVFVVSIYVAVFQCLIWTYGVSLFGAFEKKRVVRQLLTNPGLIGVAVGLPLFLLRVRCPGVLLSPIGMLADCNTPLAMLITGYSLAKMSLKKQPGDGALVASLLLRLLAVPAILLCLLRAAGVTGPLLLACMIPVSAPTASNTALFALLFSADEAYAARLISFSTLCSMLTLPLLLAVTGAVGG